VVSTDPGSPPSAKRPRAVILVGNPANPYSRAIRIGRTLVDLGYDVEIAATTEAGAPLEQRDGPLLIRRYPPSGIFASMAATYRWAPPPAKPAKRPPITTRVMRTFRARFVSWFLWPHTVRGWWKTLSTQLEPADLYHSCGTLPIAAALAARRRDQKAGRSSRVILDVIDITMESNNVLGIPSLVRRMLDRRERGWARSADAHTAVNEVFAGKARSRWRLAHTPTVVPNYPEPWTPAPGAPRPDLIREATGLPSTTRICLFWGRLGPYVGLDQAAEAVLQVPDTALVLLGFGRGWERSVARDADPTYAGRHFTLPAVHPDDLPSWVASADVALCTLPPLSYNQRFTTPNKFLEAMAGGTPMVLGPKLPTMEALLRREDLGRVAASMDPSDIAAAIREILDLPEAERAAWRERIATTARERYGWPTAAAAYRTLVLSLLPAE
jgi:glycosyltransferase involved in cell wall biosynthesis